MPKPIHEIIAHLRACIADSSIKATLIQTEDLAALCDAIECGADALQIGRDCVLESFEHVKTADDQLLADARLRDIDDALRHPRLSVREKMAQWHDAHAAAFPADSEWRKFHESTAAELRDK